MSVIYRSLQQLKEKESQRTSRTTPQAVAPRMSKLVIRAGIFLVIFLVLILSGVYFVRQEVQQIAIPPAQDTMAREKVATLSGRGEAIEKIMEGDVSAAEGPGGRKTTQMPAQEELPIVRRSLARPVAVRTREPMDLTKPTQALETHFATQARKNESVLSLERKLLQSTGVGDISRSKDILSSMSVEIGKRETSIQHKWNGYLALKEKRYADAEDFYRKAIALKPTDYVSNINLVYALMGQDKMAEAVFTYRELLDRWPMNEKVLKLGKALGER